MEEKKGCVTFNVNCCGEKGSEQAPKLKYAQLEADIQTVTEGKMIHFNSNSFGTLELTSNGTLILQPGVYFTGLNCQIRSTNSYLSMSYYDLLSEKFIGNTCSRVSSDRSTIMSCSEGMGIIKIDIKVELCICAGYVDGNVNIEDVYGSVIQIA